MRIMEIGVRVQFFQSVSTDTTRKLYSDPYFPGLR
jgi:hypothetical protein